MHRVVWSFAVVALVLMLRGDRHWLAAVRAQPGALPRLAAAAVLVATNWLVYVWAVNHDHVVEAALGYYINPLITVALAVVVLREHLRRLQLMALGFGGGAVAVMTVACWRDSLCDFVLSCTFAIYGFF